MKKLIALCMVLAISTTALCACANGDEKTNDTDNTSSVSADSATEEKSVSEDEAQKKLDGEFTSSDGLYECKIIDDNSLMIIDYYEPNSMTELVVPSTIDGYTVTEIYHSVFNDLQNTSSVTLPDTVINLYDYAFSDGSYTDIKDKERKAPKEGEKDGEIYTPTGTEKYKNVNPSLKKVVLPNSIKTIPTRCFRACSSLEQVILPNELEGIEIGAFQYCSSLKSIEFPDTLYWISQKSFYGCSSLKEVNIPKYVVNISSDAFEYCTSLEKAHLEDGVNLTSDNVLWLRSSFVTNNPAFKEIYIPESFTGRFDFITYNYEGKDAEGEDIYIPDYEKTKKSLALQSVEHVTFYGKSGSTTEEAIKNCGLKFVATDEEQTD